uniref:General transcription factor 3C polypeptide 2 n=1 Tax=Rhabditophanes sp. KR3021 TaxID=114890 RepID=A0AC35UHY4_9BILA
MPIGGYNKFRLDQMADKNTKKRTTVGGTRYKYVEVPRNREGQTILVTGSNGTFYASHYANNSTHKMEKVVDIEVTHLSTVSKENGVVENEGLKMVNCTSEFYFNLQETVRDTNVNNIGGQVNHQEQSLVELKDESMKSGVLDISLTDQLLPLNNENIGRAVNSGYVSNSQSNNMSLLNENSNTDSLNDIGRMEDVCTVGSGYQTDQIRGTKAAVLLEDCGKSKDSSSLYSLEGQNYDPLPKSTDVHDRTQIVEDFLRSIPTPNLVSCGSQTELHFSAFVHQELKKEHRKEGMWKFVEYPEEWSHLFKESHRCDTNCAHSEYSDSLNGKTVDSEVLGFRETADFKVKAEFYVPNYYRTDEAARQLFQPNLVISGNINTKSDKNGFVYKDLTTAEIVLKKFPLTSVKDVKDYDMTPLASNNQPKSSGKYYRDANNNLIESTMFDSGNSTSRPSANEHLDLASVGSTNPNIIPKSFKYQRDNESGENDKAESEISVRDGIKGNYSTTTSFSEDD